MPSASPLSRSLDNVKRMEDAGASAIIMYSLFEEQILQDQEELNRFLTQSKDAFAEAQSYFPEPEEFYNMNAEAYLDQIRKIKQTVDIPVIGSLNGVSPGGWMKYASEMEQAGADAIELNIYYVAADPTITPSDVEQMYIDDVKAAKSSVRIPVSIKIGPYFNNFSYMAQKLDEAGADGLVLFNRFYQPDIDLEHREIVPNLIFSTPFDLRLPLRWIAILYGRLKASLGATGGIHNGQDAVKMILAGADVTMMASALYIHGIDKIKEVIDGLSQWMEANEYASVEEMKGSMSYQNVAHPAAYARANYMRTLQSIK